MTSDNEMNNQAAQTMPWIQERELIRAALCKELDTNIESDERTYTIAVRAANALHWRQIEIDQLKAQVAALSQTAGVSDFHDCKQASNEMAEIHARLLTAADDLLSYAIKRSNRVPAAPAASGGDRPEPDARCNCGWGDVKDHLREECSPKDEATHPPSGASQSSNPNPVTPGLSSESAASVSERARALLAAEYERANFPDVARTIREGGYHWDSIRALELRAIEQALAQQRGADPCLYVKPRLVEILHKLGPAQTEHRVMVSTVPDAQYTVCLSTTPQPGAEALREYITRLNEAHTLAATYSLTDYEKGWSRRGKVIADELESLLARGGAK